jgi:uncharacterized protein (DUF488 family)
MSTLLTIGYEGHGTPESLVERLAAAGVRRLIDVRELPLSRKRGFSKTALSRSLGEAGITYEHVRALGNPKRYRDLYKAGDVPAGERGFRAYLHNGSYSALVELADSLGDEVTCLLCYETSHEVCHRAVIVEAVAERLSGLTVTHLE